MNVRNSITDRISSIVPVLKELKKNEKIIDDFVNIEFEFPQTISVDEVANVKFTVKCALNLSR